MQTEPLARRRTFAIISHPDAGKTTLTEKLLLHGNAIQLAGEVKAKANRRHTRSDWMKIEQERGISVMTSVMTFTHDDHVFNLLDTPGHEDFSEDTYRTLSAVDSAVMVIDAAKGIEARTLKLFEVCRLRDIPIITFINKLDREALEPFDLLHDIEQTLALDTTPVTWPIGSGRTFAGTYDLAANTVRFMDDALDDLVVSGPDDPALAPHLPPGEEEQTVEAIMLAQEACKPFDQTSFLEGHLSPVLFGSALRDFGVDDLINLVGRIAPPPQPLEAANRTVEPDEGAMTGFVFKIQANMDPNHRDRIAFMRICSGHLKRGMRARLTRTGKMIHLHTPQFFFAQDRALADEALAGDVVGIPNHGTLRIGDTLTEGEDLAFRGIPSFAPEILRRVRVEDALKAKKLTKAMEQMAEEGVVQVFIPADGSPVIVGVVGVLQLDVLIGRLQAEYNLSIAFEPTRFSVCRWLVGDPAEIDKFVARHRSAMATDIDGAHIFMAESPYMMNFEQERWPQITFVDVKDYQTEAA